MNTNIKGLFFILIILGAFYFDYPTLNKMFTDTKDGDTVLLEEKHKFLEDSLNSLKNINLSVVDLENKRIRILKSQEFEGEIDVNHPAIKSILNDNFNIEKEDKSLFLSLKDGASSDIFLSEISGQLNSLFDNVRKISGISFNKEVPEITVTMEEGRRIANVSEPIKSFVGDELDWVYNSLANDYSATAKENQYSLNLGLDLKGGIYLDLGIDGDKVVQEELRSKSESLKTNFARDEKDYEAIHLIENNSIEISLFSKEQLDIRSTDYTALIEGYDVVDTPQGYVLTMTNEEADNIRKSALEQAMTTIRNRIDQLGVKEPTVSKKGSDSIIVQLPGVSDPDRAVNIIKQTAVLEFRFVNESASTSNPGEDNEVLAQETLDPISKEVLDIQQLVVEKNISMKGSAISTARVAFDQLGSPYVSLTLKSEFADLFGEITANNVNRRMAIILDGKIQSAPNINEPIYGGLASISGNFTVNDARDLALILRSGALPAPLIINEQKTVGASLGEETIRKSMLALLSGFVVLIIFMIVMYNLAGLFAVFTLIFNLALLLAFMSYFGATLTLPGVAGIILTIGMAVDANVLIFERIREEMAQGGSLRQVIETSFKRAFTTILDSNLTTLLSAAILFEFGSGPIKGFAVTLSIGILTSMFSSLLFTKFLLELKYYRNKTKQLKISI